MKRRSFLRLFGVAAFAAPLSKLFHAHNKPIDCASNVIVRRKSFESWGNACSIDRLITQEDLEQAWDEMHKNFNKTT